MKNENKQCINDLWNANMSICHLFHGKERQKPFHLHLETNLQLVIFLFLLCSQFLEFLQ